MVKIVVAKGQIKRISFLEKLKLGKLVLVSFDIFNCDNLVEPKVLRPPKLPTVPNLLLFQPKRLHPDRPVALLLVLGELA